MDLDRIKEANPIEDVIDQDEPLHGTGRYRRGRGHDSLIVDTHTQSYFWNARGEQGDVIAWVMARQRWAFKEAVEWLAQRGGLPAPAWGSQDSATAQANRRKYEALTVACRHFVRKLREDDAGRAYCSSRGWTDEAVQAAGLGLTGGDLAGEFSLHEIDAEAPAARAAANIPAGMLVYPHVWGGKVVYASARSLGEKRHYNPPVDLIGERRLYFNWLYSTREETVVVVEGQADAVTMGQWNYAAIALAGVAVNQQVLKALARHKHVYVALDQDEAGVAAARQIADALGPLTHVVAWPEGIKDANDWLVAGATEEECHALLAAAPIWVALLAQEAAAAENSQRVEAIQRVMRLVHRMDDFEITYYRKELAEAMGLGIRQFDGMLKAVADDVPQVGSDEPAIIIPMVGGQIQCKGDDPDAYYLVETLYQPPKGAAGAEAVSGGRTLFAVRDPEGKIYTAMHVDVDGVRYIPPPPEAAMLVKRVVSFSESVGPEIKTGTLINDIQSVIHKYVDLDPFFEKLSAYYILFTWLYDAFNTIPYLRFQGDYGTGKSRARKVIGALCFRPMRASGAATVSPIFRLIDVWRGTLLVEEADYAVSDYAQEIIKIYNQGYDREQGIVLRSGDKTKGFETEAFVCFGPKVIAMRGEFKDAALTSRFLTKEMAETTRSDIPIEMPRAFELEEAPRLRGMLLRHRLKNWRPYVHLNVEALDLSVEPRLNQIALALFSIVEDPDLVDELKAFIREYNKRLIEERGLSLAAKVLEAIVVQCQLERDNVPDPRDWDLSTLTITRRTNQLMDFENWGYDDYIAHAWGAKNKTEVSDRKVGSILRTKLQLLSERSSRFNGRHVVIWDSQRIDGLRKRYGVDDARLVNLLEIIQRLDGMEDDAQAERDKATDAAKERAERLQGAPIKF